MFNFIFQTLLWFSKIFKWLGGRGNKIEMENTLWVQIYQRNIFENRILWESAALVPGEYLKHLKTVLNRREPLAIIWRGAFERLMYFSHSIPTLISISWPSTFMKSFTIINKTFVTGWYMTISDPAWDIFQIEKIKILLLINCDPKPCPCLVWDFIFYLQLERNKRQYVFFLLRCSQS